MLSSSDDKGLLHFPVNPIGKELNTNLIVNEKKKCVAFEELSIGDGVTVVVNGTLEII